MPKTFQNWEEIPLVVICKSQFEPNFLLLASETTLTHTVYSRDRACDHQVEESGPQRGEERVQVDGDRRDDQVVHCQPCILGSSRFEGHLPDIGRHSFYSNIL